MLRLALLALAAAFVVPGAAGAAGPDEFVGDWGTDVEISGSVVSTGPPAQPGSYLSIRRATRAQAAKAIGNPPPDDPGGAWNRAQFVCLGGIPKSSGVTNPRATAWFVATYSWAGGGELGGCMSDRTDIRGGVNLFDPKRNTIGITITTGAGVTAITGGMLGPGVQWKLYGTKSGCQKARTTSSASAINEVRVVSCVESAEWRRGGGAWQPLARNQVLQQGDEVSTDPDGSIVLAFADNSTVTVRPGTQVKIASFFTEGGVTRTELLLGNGEIAATVNRSETTRSDFRVRQPAGVSSVRGTTFSVFVDPVSKAGVTTVQQGSVAVDPNRPGAPTVTVGAGKEVELTPAGTSAVAPVGKAGAVGGVNRATALRLVLRAIARVDDGCAVRASGATTKAAAGAWSVSVKLAGKLSGPSQWSVKGAKAVPTNGLAKRLAAGCG